MKNKKIFNMILLLLLTPIVVFADTNIHPNYENRIVINIFSFAAVYTVILRISRMYTDPVKSKRVKVIGLIIGFAVLIFKTVLINDQLAAVIFIIDICFAGVMKPALKNLKAKKKIALLNEVKGMTNKKVVTTETVTSTTIKDGATETVTSTTVNNGSTVQSVQIVNGMIVCPTCHKKIHATVAKCPFCKTIINQQLINEAQAAVEAAKSKINTTLTNSGANVNPLNNLPPHTSPAEFDEIFRYSTDVILEKFIARELIKCNIYDQDKLIPAGALKRKNILFIMYSMLISIYVVLFFFHFPIYTYIIGGIILLITYKYVKKYDFMKFLKKEVLSRPGEKVSNIIMSTKNSMVTDTFKTFRIIVLVIACIIPCVIFATPKILYEKMDGGYGVRYYAFGLFNMTKAEIPDTHKGEKVISLRGNTFSNMPFLKEVKLSDNITEIRGQAFKNTRVEKVTLPSNLEYLGGGAFYGCKHLKSIELPNSLTYLGGEAFYQASSLETVVLSENLSEIRGDTFEYCTSLKSISIPDSVVRIGGHAFYGDKSLENVYISENSKLSEIGSSAFRMCDSLHEITLPRYTSVNSRAFKESPTNIKYYGEEYNDYDEYNSYEESYYNTENDIIISSLPYTTDYMTFDNRGGYFYQIPDINMRLHFYTGTLKGIYNEAYLSGTVYNNESMVGQLNIKVYLYDIYKKEIASRSNIIHLRGGNFDEETLFTMIKDSEISSGYTLNDIYYFKLEITNITTN